jgi:hypothetical protein
MTEPAVKRAKTTDEEHEELWFGILTEASRALSNVLKKWELMRDHSKLIPVPSNATPKNAADLILKTDPDMEINNKISVYHLLNLMSSLGNSTFVHDTRENVQESVMRVVDSNWPLDDHIFQKSYNICLEEFILSRIPITLKARIAWNKFFSAIRKIPEDKMDYMSAAEQEEMSGFVENLQNSLIRSATKHFSAANIDIY